MLTLNRPKSIRAQLHKNDTVSKRHLPVLNTLPKLELNGGVDCGVLGVGGVTHDGVGGVAHDGEGGSSLSAALVSEMFGGIL